MKKYTVYVFPGFNGNPKQFSTYLGAFLYAFLVSVRTDLFTCELKNNKTGKYKAYWL